MINPPTPPTPHPPMPDNQSNIIARKNACKSDEMFFSSHGRLWPGFQLLMLWVTLIIKPCQNLHSLPLGNSKHLKKLQTRLGGLQVEYLKNAQKPSNSPRYAQVLLMHIRYTSHNDFLQKQKVQVRRTHNFFIKRSSNVGDGNVVNMACTCLYMSQATSSFTEGAVVRVVRISTK